MFHCGSRLFMHLSKSCWLVLIIVVYLLILWWILPASNEKKHPTGGLVRGCIEAHFKHFCAIQFKFWSLIVWLSFRRMSRFVGKCPDLLEMSHVEGNVPFWRNLLNMVELATTWVTFPRKCHGICQNYGKSQILPEVSVSCRNVLKNWSGQNSWG